MRDALLAAMDGLAAAQARQQESAGCVAEEVRAANRATEAQLHGEVGQAGELSCALHCVHMCVCSQVVSR